MLVQRSILLEQKQRRAVMDEETIVNQLRIKFHNISENIICGDFTKEIPFDFLFDAVLDILTY